MRKQKLNASNFEVVLLCLFLKHKIHVPWSESRKRKKKKCIGIVI